LRNLFNGASSIERKELTGGDHKQQEIGPVKVTEDIQLFTGLAPPAPEGERELPRGIRLGRLV
jgi:hypothetical protein